MRGSVGLLGNVVDPDRVAVARGLVEQRILGGDAEVLLQREVPRDRLLLDVPGLGGVGREVEALLLLLVLLLFL